LLITLIRVSEIWDVTAEDQAALVKREGRERVSRVEVESTTALASSCGKAEGFARRIALL
jgi:hypothetical protein